MTEKIKIAKDFLIKETYCKFNKGDCDLDCGVCEYNTDSYGYDGDAQKAIYDTAIRSLKAWEEVIEKLEEREIEYSNNEFKPLADNMYYWRVRNLGIRDAINIINQKLAEIEE